jgi:hypothetical protein
MFQPSCNGNLNSRLSKSAVPIVVGWIMLFEFSGCIGHLEITFPSWRRAVQIRTNQPAVPRKWGGQVPFASPPTGKMASDRQWLSKLGKALKPNVDKPDLNSRLSRRYAVANYMYRFAYSNYVVKSQNTSARATAHLEAVQIG